MGCPGVVLATAIRELSRLLVSDRDAELVIITCDSFKVGLAQAISRGFGSLGRTVRLTVPVASPGQVVPSVGVVVAYRGAAIRQVVNRVYANFRCALSAEVLDVSFGFRFGSVRALCSPVGRFARLAGRLSCVRARGALSQLWVEVIPSSFMRVRSVGVGVLVALVAHFAISYSAGDLRVADDRSGRMDNLPHTCTQKRQRR